MNCPKCGTEAVAGARFCEIDGTLLSNVPFRVAPEDVLAKANVNDAAHGGSAGGCRCGAGPDAIDESGFCTECGVRAHPQPHPEGSGPLDPGLGVSDRAVDARDHIEFEPAAEFAGVTDRGVRHSENQDDLALAVVQTDIAGQAIQKTYVAVVCDGVSGSEGASGASAAAAATACATIERVLREQKLGVALEAVMRSAIVEADTAVRGVDYFRGTAKDPPETTIVAAVVTGNTAVIGWSGDSRAYWITPTQATMITRDHSWVNDVVDNGLMSEADALRSPMAHAIVRCLGGPAPDTISFADQTDLASVVRCILPAGSRLLLCSDGLWNYAQTVDEIADLVRSA